MIANHSTGAIVQFLVLQVNISFLKISWGGVAFDFSIDYGDYYTFLETSYFQRVLLYYSFFNSSILHDLLLIMNTIK